MIFNSVTFLVFFTLVSLLYWSLRPIPRYWMLFIASLVFYGFWRWEYLIVMMVSAMTDYFVAQWIYDTPAENKRKRRLLLYITLFVNLGLLVYFKYLMFFTDNFNFISEKLGWGMSFPVAQIILPFGISFYTFETISYTMDVYRGHLKPERSFLVYGLFVSFFPKLVAGPIQRASELVSQLKSRPSFELGFVTEGIQRILYGLFLKVVLADNISPLVDEGFSMPVSNMSGVDVLTLAFLFGFQIYFDFSAYSHIAVGSAKVLGISIPENFNFPYIATSLKDFWKRWHISLSSWIRDYLYLPLTGTKVLTTTGKGGIGQSLNDKEPTNFRKDLALFLTWAIMGLWHGANWTFVIWGVYHATFIFLERKLKFVRDGVSFFRLKWVNWGVTLLIAMVSWIPFRAETVSYTMGMFGKLIRPSGFLHLGLRENNYLVAGLLLLLFILAWVADEYGKPWLEKHRWAGATFSIAKFTIIILLTFIFLRPISQFIYFQF